MSIRITCLKTYIEERIERITETGCWIWTNGLDGFGYGQAQTFGKHSTAHRLAWTVYKGPIPKGIHVLHRCDVPQCCNPYHLFLGTQRDNIDDMVAKNRSLKGERHPMVKLTREQALDALTSTETITVVARRLGCTVQNIWRIRNRQTWKELSM
jgi:hypothetical protein